MWVHQLVVQWVEWERVLRRTKQENVRTSSEWMEELQTHHLQVNQIGMESQETKQQQHHHSYSRDWECDGVHSSGFDGPQAAGTADGTCLSLGGPHGGWRLNTHRS